MKSIASILLLALLTTSLHADELALPDLGDRSSSSLGHIDEAIIGRSMIRGLYYSGQLVQDPLLDEYLDGLGARLLRSSQAGGGNYHFYLLDDPSINAFAMPGGHIAIHTGLILSSNSEDELAAVVAHEIAHVSQRHLARRYESLEDLNVGISAAMIAAILLSSSYPNLAQAALATGLAVGEDTALNYSRNHEHEADRVGIQMLADAGFDPESMASFFEKLEQANRYNLGVIPEFLSTHPITSNRIVEARNRAASLAPKPASPSDSYSMAKARIAALTLYADDSREENLKQLMEERGDIPSRYSYALALLDGGKAKEALPYFESLLREEPTRIAFHDGLSRCHLELGHNEKALSGFRNALDLYPGNLALTLSYSDALLKLGQAEAARQQLSNWLRRYGDQNQIYRQLARAEGELGNTVEANLALAESLYLVGDTRGAIDQLMAAQRHPKSDFYLQERIDSRLQQLQYEIELNRAWSDR